MNETEEISIERLTLRARARLSLARMYLKDLENEADFGRMVDGKGSAFNCSEAKWIEFILRIATETIHLLPEHTALVIERLTIACPNTVIPKELLPHTKEVSR